MRKDAGFTMIELLAAVVILGILLSIAIPTVSGVLKDSRNRTYIDDALRLVSSFDSEIRRDNKMPIPKIGGCVIMNLTYLDNNTFDDAPYEGEYSRIYSFVVAKRVDKNRYVYYPRLVEKLTDQNGYRGIDLTESDKLYEKNAGDIYVKNLGAGALYDVSTQTNSTLVIKLSTYGIDCGSEVPIVYAPNAEGTV